MPNSLCGNVYFLPAHPFLTVIHSFAHQLLWVTRLEGRQGAGEHTKVTGWKGFPEAPRWKGLGLEGAHRLIVP